MDLSEFDLTIIHRAGALLQLGRAADALPDLQSAHRQEPYDEEIAALLAAAAASVAGPTHRNMATVGGNLCLDTRCIFYNQSEWWLAVTCGVGANSWRVRRAIEQMKFS